MKSIFLKSIYWILTFLGLEPILEIIFKTALKYFIKLIKRGGVTYREIMYIQGIHILAYTIGRDLVGNTDSKIDDKLISEIINTAIQFSKDYNFELHTPGKVKN